MFSKLVLAASITVLVFGITADRMYGRAGDLQKPGIAIASPDGTPDATAVAINRILMAHEKQFVSGHYINAHSELRFTGGTKTINSLLAELSKVEGATVYIRFSKSSGDFGFLEKLPGAAEDLPRDHDCVVDHNGWADAQSLTITIYLGGNVAAEDLAIPAIHGHAAR